MMPRFAGTRHQVQEFLRERGVLPEIIGIALNEAVTGERVVFTGRRQEDGTYPAFTVTRLKSGEYEVK